MSHAINESHESAKIDENGIFRYEELVLSNANIKDLSPDIKDFKNYHFNYVGGKDGHFDNVDFSYSVWNYCYFRKATFTNCNFTGCFFERCNFREAQFENCNFSYINANETFISAEDILNNLTQKPNVNLEICRNMKKNALSNANIEDCRKYYLEELNQTWQHLVKASRGETKYYREKYGSCIKYAGVIFKMFSFKLSGTL